MLGHGITPANLLFLVFVTLAVYAQNLTGFALALILLGLVGTTELFPLPDVVNVASIITLVNAALFLYRRRALRLLLGLSIVACACMLWRRAAPLATSSTPASFVSIGLLSGLMGGFFARAGRPWCTRSTGSRGHPDASGNP